MAVTELKGRLETRKGEWHRGICPAGILHRRGERRGIKGERERERGKWGVGEYDGGEVERPRWKHPVRILGGFYDVD